MAKKKDVKKDIRHLTEQVIIDSIEVSEMIEKTADKNKVYKLIAEVADTHNQLISRANKPDAKNNPKLVKEHYNMIYQDLLNACNIAYEKLQKLIPSE